MIISATFSAATDGSRLVVDTNGTLEAFLTTNGNAILSDDQNDTMAAALAPAANVVSKKLLLIANYVPIPSVEFREGDVIFLSVSSATTIILGIRPID